MKNEKVRPMTEPEKEYIITKKTIDDIAALLQRCAIYQSIIDDLFDPVYNRPYTSAKTVLDELETAIKNNWQCSLAEICYLIDGFRQQQQEREQR